MFTLLFLNIGGSEIILVMLFVLLFFGANKIPELARGLGKGLRELKDATDGIQRELENSIDNVKKTASIDQDFEEVTERIKKDTEIQHTTEHTETPIVEEQNPLLPKSQSRQ